MTWIYVIAEFFKTGLFAIGGGLATLPFLYDLADKYGWFTRAELSDMIAVSESTPGPIGINCATYAGVNAIGVWGGIVSTMGLVLPSLIVILIVAKILDKFQNNRFVGYAFDGIRPAVTAMIAVAFVDVFKESILTIETFMKSKNFLDVVDIRMAALFVFLFLVMRKFKRIHPIVFIVFSAVVGIIFKF